MYAHLIDVRKSCVQTAHSVSCCTAVQLLQFTLSGVNTLVERWQAARASWTTLWWSRDNSRSTSLLSWRQKMQQPWVTKSLSCFVLYLRTYVVVRKRMCVRVPAPAWMLVHVSTFLSPSFSSPLTPSLDLSPLPLSPSPTLPLSPSPPLPLLAFLQVV